MAKQLGLIKLKGTIDEITFVKTRHGYIARQRARLNGNRFAADGAFVRIRENAAEFGRAGKAVKLLRTAINNLLVNAKDPTASSRLVRQMVRVIKADTTSIRGERTAAKGDLVLLEGFNFNGGAPLTAICRVIFRSTISRAAGSLEIALPSFVPVQTVTAPEGTTHLRFVSAAVAIDFNAGSFVQTEDKSEVLPWNGTEIGELKLSCALPPATTNPIFLLLGINFYQEVNSTIYPLNNTANNALCIIRVDQS